MTKYRLRLENGRVIGPFDLNQIHDLKVKGHIVGNEEAQVFPLGDWKPMTAFDFYVDLMDDNKTVVETKKEDATFVIDISHIRQKRNEKDIDKMSVDEPAPKTPEQITETIRITSTKINSEGKNSGAAARGNTAITISQEFQLPKDSDKTLINPVAQEELRKMRKLQEEAEQEAREKEEALKNEMVAYKEKSRSINNAIVVSPEDATQVISLGNSNKTELLNLANVEELAIDQEVQDFLRKRREEEGELEDDDEEEVEASDVDIKKAKRKKLIVVVAILALLYVVLFPDDEKEKPPFRHLAPQIVFAVPFDKKDQKKAADLYKKGMDSYMLGTYPHLVNAGGFFRQSAENDYDNMLAYSMMVRSYGEELRFSKKKLQDALNLFKIIQVKKQYLIHHPDGVVGMNQFFMSIDKPEAAVDVVKKYLRLHPQRVTQDLYASYLYSLIKMGRVDEGTKKMFTSLSKQKEKSRYSLEAMIEFLKLNQDYDQAMDLINDGIKRFPNTSFFYLQKCDILLRKKELKEIPALLSIVEAKNIEYNDIYRAKFFEVSGLYWALKGDVKRATQFLVMSLNIIDSNDLRMKLADLDATGKSQAADKIIAQSKAVKLLFEARNFHEQKNYALAMSSAARATEIYPGHIPSELFLAKMQMKLGLASQSLKTLEKLVQKYPGNRDINLALIEAYTASYKFNDARNRIAVISGTDIRNSWEYASVNAKLYQRMGDTLKSIAWYRSSINANPLNDDDIHELAEILLRRKNFDQARLLLNNAIELDPVKPDYRLAYARLIYETEDDQAAVGYLISLLNDFGENPKILGEIATFYYKSGKIKDFEDYKKKLEKLPTRDKALYEFLIKAAVLDERYGEVPHLVEELLKIEPGDLESMMTAGKVLFENDKYSEAAVWFKRLWERMPTYPKVLYYIARIKFIIGEIDDPTDAQGNPVFENGEKKLGAMTLVKNDMKENGESDIALTFLAEIFAKKGDLVQAENHYKKAQKINPRSYEALVGLADISTRRNNYDLALDLYKKALKQRGDEPDLHKKIGDVYRLLGQGTLAIESYKMYLEMDPEASDKPQIDKYMNLMQ
jgi:tetratricopeptide (TPR) repeat protein